MRTKATRNEADDDHDVDSFDDVDDETAAAAA